MNKFYTSTIQLQKEINKETRRLKKRGVPSYPAKKIAEATVIRSAKFEFHTFLTIFKKEA